MAGGDTEVGGNGSVYWKVHHYKDPAKNTHDQHQSPGGPHAHPAEHKVKLGGGEVEGHDETHAPEIGDRVGVPGNFLVTLRFPTKGAAQAAVNQGLQSAATTPFFLSIAVPAIARPDADKDPPYEVKTEW